VLHRDIKPANILLDLQGTAWVTDFGLAKEEGENLTRTGDIVGTLRYMAPERLSGSSCPRSDIYSLGLTLFELVTLQPAFPETDRVTLLRQITQVEPPRPRRLDPHIPRDLETIVLKAIAKEPLQRYQSAAELAEDLGRFLADRPILARRNSPLALTWRWVRRNPGWAATAGGVLGLLLILAVGGAVLNVHLQALNLHLLDAVTTAQDAERDKTDKLWQALLEKARAARTSGRIGQRFEALKAIRQAAAIRNGPELRDEATAALVLPDLEVAREWNGYPEGTIDLAFDAAFERFARINKNGELTVCRLTMDGEEVLAHLPAHGQPPYHGLWLSPDGRFLVYGHTCEGESLAHGLRIWKIDGTAPVVLRDEPRGKNGWAVSFHPSRPLLAVGHADGTISVYDLLKNQCVRRIKLGYPPLNIAFHPTSGLLAAACGSLVRLVDTDTGRELTPLQQPDTVDWTLGLAWHPEGGLLAVGCNDGRIRVWQAEKAAPVWTTGEGQRANTVYLTFNHSGDRLASVAWSASELQIWDANSGRLCLAVSSSGDRLQFGRDDSLLGYLHGGGKVRLYHFADGRELRVLQRRNAAPLETIFSLLHADGRTLAAASVDRLSFFDLKNGTELASVALAGSNTACPRHFCQSGGWLTTGNGGLCYWPDRPDADRSDLHHVGPPRRLAPLAPHGASASLDGSIVALPQGSHARTLDLNRPGWHVDLGPLYDVRHCAVSPDGRWVVTCSWWWDGRSPGIRIWEAETGRHVWDIPSEGGGAASFSPDGHWLATTSRDQPCSLWEVGSWRAGPRFKERVALFSPDSKLLAFADDGGAIRFKEPATGREVFRLTGPEPICYYPNCFGQDGTHLVATGSKALYVWDLRLIRSQLQEMGLDWVWPEFPPAQQASPPRRTVEVDPGVLRPHPFKDDRQTVAVYSLFLALQSVNPEAHFWRGLAYGRLSQSRAAIEDYSKFLALTPRQDPRRIEILCRRATNYDILNDYSGLAAALEELLAVEPDRFPWPDLVALQCNHVAWHYVLIPPPKPWPSNLLAFARKAVEIEPYNSAYQNTLGGAYYRSDRWEHAVACLEQNVRTRQDWAGWDYYFLAMSCEQLGQNSRARDYFERAEKWAQQHANLPPEHAREIAALRAEAAGLLRISPSAAKEGSPSS
jgi:WD40 repeat protein